MKTNEARSLLRNLFEAAITAAQPAHCVPLHLPEPPRGRLIVIGAGKASAAMAKALEESWPGELSGLVVTRYGYAVPCQRIEIVEAAHPVPDAAGVTAAERIHARGPGTQCRRYRAVPDFGVGGSSLLALPLEGLSLADKQAVNRALAQVRRLDRGDELRPPPPLGDQGRASGRSLPSRARVEPHDLRRARRQPDRHCLRSDGC
jgi:glycerate 2-kinase